MVRGCCPGHEDQLPKGILESGFILADSGGMLTRREVLLQLKRVGVTEASQMKTYVRDFEMYMAKNHGISISKAKTGGQHRAKSKEHRA